MEKAVVVAECCEVVEGVARAGMSFLSLLYCT
jgi:hypothetical protein